MAFAILITRSQLNGCVRIASTGHIAVIRLASRSQLDLTSGMRRARRLQRPLAHVRGGRGGATRIDRVPTGHRAVLPLERVRGAVLVVEELEEHAESASPGPVRRGHELAPVGYDEGGQVDGGAEQRGGAGDEEEAPEAAEAEAGRRELAALHRAALGVAEPLALDQAQLVALRQVQDRPRQVRHVRRPPRERLLVRTNCISSQPIHTYIHMRN